MKISKQKNSLIENRIQVIAIKKRNGSWSYVPKLSNPFRNPHINFPHPHELTGNDITTKRENI